jgi:hypothetical protein
MLSILSRFWKRLRRVGEAGNARAGLAIGGALVGGGGAGALILNACHNVHAVHG